MHKRSSARLFAEAVRRLHKNLIARRIVVRVETAVVWESWSKLNCRTEDLIFLISNRTNSSSEKFHFLETIALNNLFINKNPPLLLRFSFLVGLVRQNFSRWASWNNEPLVSPYASRPITYRFLAFRVQPLTILSSPAEEFDDGCVGSGCAGHHPKFSSSITLLLTLPSPRIVLLARWIAFVASRI